MKGTSSPVIASINGGRKVSFECGILKWKVFTWWPMRSKAAMFACLVKVAALNVIHNSLNKIGAAPSLQSWQVSRKDAASSLSRDDKRLSRALVVCQNLENEEAVDMVESYTALEI